MRQTNFYSVDIKCLKFFISAVFGILNYLSTCHPHFICKQFLLDQRVGLKRYELNGRKVLFYFDEVRLLDFC